jgi:capsular polysaccharide biosynthesis protein
LAVERIVLKGGLNEWYDKALPEPLNMRLGLSHRPAYLIKMVVAPEIFISPYGYQAFDRKREVYWPEASSRTFSRSITDYDVIKSSRVNVIVQDQFDGGNFSHFLFDAVLRVILFAESFGRYAKNVNFVFGGVRTDFHNIILSLLSEHLQIDGSHFIFPDARCVIETEAPTFVFSDQKSPIMHPIAMCHPAALRLLRDMLGKLELSDFSERKIYISRRDANMRRVSNEDAFLGDLVQRGFDVLTLGEMSAWDQITAVATAKVIVAPHGMGLTHLAFQRRISHVIELFNPLIGSDAYAFISKALGIEYDHIVGIDTGGPNKDFDINRADLLAKMHSF